jgi:hypothetical protein
MELSKITSMLNINLIPCTEKQIVVVVYITELRDDPNLPKKLVSALRLKESPLGVAHRLKIPVSIIQFLYEMIGDDETNWNLDVVKAIGASEFCRHEDHSPEFFMVTP